MAAVSAVVVASPLGIEFAVECGLGREGLAPSPLSTLFLMVYGVSHAVRGSIQETMATRKGFFIRRMHAAHVIRNSVFLESF